MNTPNKKYELKVNNFFSNTLNNKDKEKTNKIKGNHKRQSRKYDEIEAKDVLIKQNISQVKKIKMESIKELIYTYKKVPKNWQNQKNYRNQIFEMFSKNPKFLHYLGSAYNTNTETKIPKEQNENVSLTNKNNYENKNDDLNSSIKKMKIKMKKLNLSPIPEKPKSKNNFNKYMNTTPNPKNFTHKKENYIKPREIINILDELEIAYPIKEKINDLYPKEEIEKLNPINRNHKPVLDRRRRKQIFKNNICLNLFSNKNHKYENNENQPSEKTVTKKTKSYSLPEDCRPLKGDFQSKNYVEVIDYLTKRNKNLLSIDLRWCISQPGLFIPCIRYNNVVGYIIRNLNGKENQPKYIKYIPDGYIFNEDILRSDKKNILVFEGALDALLGNGIALLTNALTEQQAEQLKKYDKHFILVPDRDIAGKKMYESFVKYGISCSVAYPNWESSIKDFEEGTRKYGIYYSLKLIMNNVYDTTLKIKVHGNAWHQG